MPQALTGCLTLGTGPSLRRSPRTAQKTATACLLTLMLTRSRYQPKRDERQEGARRRHTPWSAERMLSVRSGDFLAAAIW